MKRRPPRKGCKRVRGKWVCPPRTRALAGRRAPRRKADPRYREWWDDPTADVAEEISADIYENLWWRSPQSCGQRLAEWSGQLEAVRTTEDVHEAMSSFPYDCASWGRYSVEAAVRFDQLDAVLLNERLRNAATPDEIEAVWANVHDRSRCAERKYESAYGELPLAPNCVTAVKQASDRYADARKEETRYSIELGVNDLSKPSGPRNYPGPRKDAYSKHLLIQRARAGRILMSILKCCLE